MNLPQWRVSVLDCASPLTLSMTHDLQSGSGLPHSGTWQSYQRFMESLPGRRYEAAVHSAPVRRVRSAGL
jgi:hypothetical protein